MRLDFVVQHCVQGKMDEHSSDIHDLGSSRPQRFLPPPIALAPRRLCQSHRLLDFFLPCPSVRLRCSHSREFFALLRPPRQMNLILLGRDHQRLNIKATAHLPTKPKLKDATRSTHCTYFLAPWHPLSSR